MLYVVATPIGNLEDITLRALRVLREADLIACEDTRHTRKLLSHFEIRTPTVSYHEHNERERAAELVAKLKSGLNIALVSDAGTPLVSDPGLRLVQQAVEQDLPVVSVPGATAFVTALAASGLPTDEFLFAGFLPSRQSARRQRLKALALLPTTLVFYEAPHRIRQTLDDALDILGSRSCVLARELTKLHEEYLRGTVAEIKEAVELRNPKGEIVLLFGPPTETPADPWMEKNTSILEEIAALMRAEGIEEKSALKRVARLRGLSKSEAYRLLVAEKKDN